MRMKNRSGVCLEGVVIRDDDIYFALGVFAAGLKRLSYFLKNNALFFALRQYIVTGYFRKCCLKQKD